MPEPDTCRSCGAPIIWAHTDKGRSMPVDADPHPQGNLKLWRSREDGVLRCAVVSSVDGAPRYRPHFATCPDAESWRHR